LFKQLEKTKNITKNSPTSQKKFKRVCLICEAYFEKRLLLKIISLEKKLVLDPENKFPSRSVYFGRSIACLEKIFGFQTKRKKKLIKKLNKLGYNFQLSDLESLIDNTKNIQEELFFVECPCVQAGSDID